MVRSKGQISWHFIFSQFQIIDIIFITNFVFSQIKDIKHIAYWPEFSLCDLDNATGVGDGVLAGSKH